ncbi:5'/3'-nucleotidase SurE [candidate division WOR-3 bacterium]|nr:5'/3'-nucleotidase SurE [candidate division WOR-3 bacterium]
MRILLTNDDGVRSKGIKTLFDALSVKHQVAIVAPAKEMNAVSHSLTLKKPLKIKKLSPGIIGVYGTPTDCVILAVYNLLDDFPELLFSGINLGPNLGEDVTYSGTIGAALEGAIIGIPSIAMSFYDAEHPDFDAGAECALKLVKIVTKVKFLKNVVLNVNIPWHPKGIKVTKLGKRIYEDVVKEKKGKYLIGGMPKYFGECGTDLEACEQGYISITPLNIDLTHYEVIKKIKEWEKFF